MKAKDYELNRSLGYLVNALSLNMKQRLDVKLKEHKVTVHQFGILLIIYKKSSLTQKEIADQTSGDEPATARLMNRLEDKGHIKRVVDKVDKRKRLVSLTQEGEILLNRLLPYAQEINEDLTSVLSQAEQKDLLIMLTKIVTSSGEK